MVSTTSSAGPVYSFLHSLPIPSLPLNIERWIPGSTPLSTTPEVVYAVAFYLVVIFGGQALMRGSKPYRESTRRAACWGRGQARGVPWGRGQAAKKGTRMTRLLASVDASSWSMGI